MFARVATVLAFEFLPVEGCHAESGFWRFAGWYLNGLRDTIPNAGAGLANRAMLPFCSRGPTLFAAEGRAAMPAEVPYHAPEALIKAATNSP